MVSAIRALVRPAVTVVLTLALIYGFVSDKISADQFVPIVVSVVAFWFGSRSNPDAGGQIVNAPRAREVTARNVPKLEREE